MQSLHTSSKDISPKDSWVEGLIQETEYWLNELASCAKPNRAKDFADKLRKFQSPKLMKDQVDVYLALGKPKKSRSYGSIWKSYKESNKDKKLSSTEWTIQNNDDPCYRALTNLKHALGKLTQYTTNIKYNRQLLAINNYQKKIKNATTQKKISILKYRKF